jgi:hypothetical protein
LRWFPALKSDPMYKFADYDSRILFRLQIKLDSVAKKVIFTMKYTRESK